jgi:hypothetical protein
MDNGRLDVRVIRRSTMLQLGGGHMRAYLLPIQRNSYLELHWHVCTVIERAVIGGDQITLAISIQRYDRMAKVKGGCTACVHQG